ncbi:MAG: hypothetical protein ACFFAQ_08655 [Promethearchaeota archaeon]
MKKKYTILSFLFLGFLIFNSIIGICVASDDDSDGVDDDFEELNKRNIDIEFDHDEVEIESTLRDGETVDEIEIYIHNENDGIHFEFSYESEYDNESESESELELEFGVVFQKIIEFVDLNDNNIYDESVDQLIQEVELDSFEDVSYAEFNISNDCKLHCFTINTTDGIFSAHVYIAEEFDFINDTLITPTEIKIDIDINNFNYLNATSQLALYVKLESELDYKEEDYTEDEKNKYASNEQGAFITNSTFLGFFTWNENATIDGVSKRVLVSEIQVDDDDDQEQKLYLNYPRGMKIHHDPKIGMAIVKSEHKPFFAIVIIGVVLLFGVTTAVAYSVHHFSGRRDVIPLIDEEERGIPRKLNQSLIQIFDEENALEKISQLGDVNLTALSENFLKVLEQLEWDLDEKEEFIKEMLSLTPKERENIIQEMIEKSNL